jgi:hypothetical protein
MTNWTRKGMKEIQGDKGRIVRLLNYDSMYIV